MSQPEIGCRSFAFPLGPDDNIETYRLLGYFMKEHHSLVSVNPLSNDGSALIKVWVTNNIISRFPYIF
jgi:hypothetical protein